MSHDSGVAYLVERLRYGLRTFSHDVHHAGHETLEEAKRILASTPDLVYTHREMCDAIELIRAEQQKRADDMPTTAKVPVLLDDDTLGEATVPVRRTTFALLEKAHQTVKQDGVDADVQLKVSNATPPDGLSLGLYLLSVYWPMGRLPVELPPDVQALAAATRAYADAVMHFRGRIEETIARLDAAAVGRHLAREGWVPVEHPSTDFAQYKKNSVITTIPTTPCQGYTPAEYVALWKRAARDVNPIVPADIMLQMWAELPAGTCASCHERAATTWWVGDSGMLGYVHGMKAPWCHPCAIRAQISHAQKQAVLLPSLRAALLAELDAVSGARRLKTVFVIASWAGEGGFSAQEQTHVATRTARVVIEAGAAPILIQATIDAAYVPKDGTYWEAYALELLLRADAAILAPNWRSAKWCAQMKAYAEQLSLPLFDLAHHAGARDLKTWAGTQPAKENGT